MSSRTFAIGDIHGCDVALEVLLDALQPASDDTVVVLGDVVDRGPDTKRCVDMLLDLQDCCQFVFLMGNHEEMMLDACRGGEWAAGWLEYGGVETMQSYGNDVDALPVAHLEFLEFGRDYFQTSDTIFVHANLQPYLPLDRQTKRWLRWHHLTGKERPHESGKRVVCGHTRQSDGLPAQLDGWLCIDTFACGGQYLTCLDTQRDLLYRSTQSGEFAGEIPLAELAKPFEAK